MSLGAKMIDYAWIVEQVSESNESSVAPFTYYLGYEVDDKPSVTHNVFMAKRYYSRLYARQVAEQLTNKYLNEIHWKAVEHGF
jgi:hypothetical protein